MTEPLLLSGFLWFCSQFSLLTTKLSLSILFPFSFSFVGVFPPVLIQPIFVMCSNFSLFGFVLSFFHPFSVVSFLVFYISASSLFFFHSSSFSPHFLFLICSTQSIPFSFLFFLSFVPWHCSVLPFPASLCLAVQFVHCCLGWSAAWWTALL